MWEQLDNAGNAAATCSDVVSLIMLMMIWAASSQFVSSSIPSWQILTAHAQPFRGARDLVFCLKVPLDSLLVWASSGGSGETARMRRLAWTFAARICYKYQIRLTRSISCIPKRNFGMTDCCNRMKSHFTHENKMTDHDSHTAELSAAVLCHSQA